MDQLRQKNTEPSQELLAKIMLRVQKEERLLVIKRRTAIFFVATLISGLAFIPAWQMLSSGLASSGFVQFLSLLFSDFEIIASSYWQNFIFSLLEAVPVVNLIIFLSVLLIFLESLQLLAKNIKLFLSLKNLFNT